MTAIALRPYLPADVARCAAIFRDAVEETAADDYDEDQRAAWAARADYEAAFSAKLSNMLTIVAVIEGEIVGFAALDGSETFDTLYVDPVAGRMGVATALVDAVVRLARARGAKRIAADVSDTAKPVFERQGFVAERRNLVTLGDQWLANTTMSKALAAAPAPAGASTRH